MITELHGEELAERIVEGYKKHNLKPVRYYIMQKTGDACCGMGVIVVEALNMEPFEVSNKIKDIENDPYREHSINDWLSLSLGLSEEYIKGFETGFDAYLNDPDETKNMDSDPFAWNDGKIVAERVNEYIAEVELD